MNSLIVEELQALTEIYNNLRYDTNNDDNNISGTFEADIKLTDIKGVVIKQNDKSFELFHFPNLVLNFSINDGATEIMYDIDCVWLSSSLKVKIIEQLKNMELDLEGMLWRWFQFLEMECLEYLFGKSEDNIVLIDINNMTGKKLFDNDKLFDLLYKYDNDRKKSVFKTSIFECGSCFEQKRGTHCISLRNCDDVFCDECARGYFNTQIKNGDLELKCLVCAGDVDYDEIKCVLNQEAFDRWDQLVLRRYLKTTGAAKSCPRCEAISPVDDSCGICPECSFAFCPKCSEAYHSGFDCEQDRDCPLCKYPCKLTDRRGICRKCEFDFCANCGNNFHEGVECSEGSFVIGNERQQEIVLKRTTKMCPKCQEGYEKLEGCNKMICPSCKVYFCHHCNKVLNRFTPYHHFGLPPLCPL